MNKFKTFYGENKTFVRLLIGCLLLLALFVGVATLSGAWPGSDASAQILSALAGAVVAAIITLFLLLGQTSSEEKKERNTKVFEEKLRIYQEFLHCLYDVIKDGKVTKEEAIQLEFQTSYITMHTESDRIKDIAKQVKNIVDSLNDEYIPSDTVNAAEKEARKNDVLMENLFGIVNEFKKELYQTVPTYKDEINSKESIKCFSSIIEAVEVEKTDKESNVSVTEPSIDLKQNLSDFTDELIRHLSLNEEIWKVNSEVGDNGIYLNIATKGNEVGTRIILSYEDSGEHYFQIHLELGDTHEIYKHMKWRFGGRQNKWCWWKYLDGNMRNLATLEEIKGRNWNSIVVNLSKNLKDLIAYVETLDKIQNEIYQHYTSKKAKVWLYYEKCVAFDYDERLFMDVELRENGYTIRLGNRDQNIPELLLRLKNVFGDVPDTVLQDGRYIAYTDLSASEAATKINEIDGKI
jgi:hypothetical protein